MKWITLDVAKATNRTVMLDDGQPCEVLSEQLLQSALARPQQLLAYSEPPPSIFELAATLAFGIAKNHSFGNGNKRTAAMLMFAFLDLNGWSLEAPEAEMVEAMVCIVDGAWDQGALARWLSVYSKPK